MLSSMACLAVLYFSTFSHKRHDFLKKKNMNIACVFWFAPQLLSETFLILRRSERDMIKNIYILIFTKNTRYSCHILMKLEFSWQIFRKHSNIKFHENPFSGSRVVACGQTDGRRDRMRKSIVAFLNFTNAPKNWSLSQ